MRNGLLSAIWASVFFYWCLGVALPSTSQDLISLRNETTGEITQFKGQVTDWDTQQLKFIANGREREIPSRRVVDVMYSRNQTQVDADNFLQAGKLAQALQAYENAIKDEPRQWVVREIRGKRLRCAAGLGQTEVALSEFFRIIQSNSRTRFFHLIPLDWQNESPSPSLIPQIQSWLDRGDEIRGLIAASWLLNINRDKAVAKLKQLRSSDDSQIAHLATAQLWRTDLISTKPDELRRWYAAIERMPDPLRAGPIYLVAQVERRQAAGKSLADLNRTLVMFMRIPILYPEQYQLAGAALLQCRQMLQDANQPERAQVVAQQLQQDFGFSTAAAKLQQNIQKIND